MILGTTVHAPLAESHLCLKILYTQEKQYNLI